LTTSRKNLLRDTRGAVIYVELLIMIPLLSLLFMSASFVHDLGRTQVQVQRSARECAWAHASAGCAGAVPAGCELEGPSKLDAPELEQVAGTGLEQAVSPVPGLPPLFRRETGDEVVARTTGTVSAPLLIGEDVSPRGTHRMMCNERPRDLQPSDVMDVSCRGLVGARCP